MFHPSHPYQSWSVCMLFAVSLSLIFLCFVPTFLFRLCVKKEIGGFICMLKYCNFGLDKLGSFSFDAFRGSHSQWHYCINCSFSDSNKHLLFLLSDVWIYVDVWTMSFRTGLWSLCNANSSNMVIQLSAKISFHYEVAPWSLLFAVFIMEAHGEEGN